MLADIKNHPWAYLMLVLMLLTFVFSFLIFWSDRFLLRGIVIMMMVGYFLWGVLVHKRSGHMSIEILKEYGLVALMGGAVLLMLTY